MARSLKQAGMSEKIVSILDIYGMIANKNYPTVREFTERCEVTERTVYRYLSVINMVDPIEYDRERGGYRFIHGDRTKKVRLSDEERTILLAAGHAVSTLGASFRESFQNIVNKIVAKTGKAPPEEKPCIIINIPDAVQADTVDGYFRIISKCMTEHCSLDITYRARHRRKSTRRTVDPYGLVFHRGAWMLVAFCHLRGEIRTFALDRIMDVKERTMPFQPLEGFDLEEFLSQSWGIYRSKEVRLKVRFSAEIADYILRRPKWHPSEKRKILADGSVELSFRIMGIEEMKGWIYSWIPNVEVIRPQWLRAQIAEELGGTAIRHE